MRHCPRSKASSVQILGWREYVRGVYWLLMPNYLQRNALKAEADLPAWYWTGDVPMRCLSETIRQTLQFGYAHHIQRLMVTGLYAMLLGVRPQQVHGWYLSVYVDAVEWVELPNTLGMSQYGDGGTMGSKPYAASGKYIDRMSNYCVAADSIPRCAPAPKPARSRRCIGTFWGAMKRVSNRTREWRCRSAICSASTQTNAAPLKAVPRQSGPATGTRTEIRLRYPSDMACHCVSVN